MEHVFSVSAKVREYDVVVSGGGLAGVAAAVSAARQGAKIALVESGGELGGILPRALFPSFWIARTRAVSWRKFLIT